MSKRVNDGEPKKDWPKSEEASPPLLGEKLIAQLQNAVRAAQRGRVPDSHPASRGTSDKEF